MKVFNICVLQDLCNMSIMLGSFPVSCLYLFAMQLPYSHTFHMTVSQRLLLHIRSPCYIAAFPFHCHSTSVQHVSLSLSFVMSRLSALPGFLDPLTLLLLSLYLLRAAANNAYVNFSPAIYFSDNFGQSSASQAPLPSPPPPPPAELTTAVIQWVYNPYNPPTPQVNVITEAVAGPEAPNTVIWVQPAPSSTVAFEPATPIATFSCSAIGEPWWGCLDTERCSFDNGGSVACCPVGEFCKGVASYGNGAGPRPGLVLNVTSRGEKGVNISRDILIGASVLQALVVGYWLACTAHEDGIVSYFVGLATGCVVTSWILYCWVRGGD